MDKDLKNSILKSIVYYFNISRTALSNLKIAELAREEYIASFLNAIKHELHSEIQEILLKTDNVNLRWNLLEYYSPFNKSFCEKVFNENLNKGVPAFRAIFESGRKFNSEDNVKMVLSFLKKIDKKYKLNIDFYAKVDEEYKHLLN